jgi:integrase
MAYADKRDGRLTGAFVGEAPKLHKKRRFKTLQDAKDYETFCKLMGREPPTIDDGMESTGAPTFAQVVEMAKKVGGPDGKWLAGKDRSLMQRLDYCVGIIGPYEIQRTSREVLRKITASLERAKAPGKRHKLSNATKNRYLAAAGAVLTFAFNEELIPARPNVPMLDEEEDRKVRDILQLGQEDVVMRLMCEAGHEVDADCVDMLIQTGLRSGELLRKLGPDQVTIETITDDETGTDVHVGVLRLHRGQNKNGKTARQLVFSAELAAKIKAYIVAGSMPDGYQLLRHFKSACARAGYTGNLVIHSLRHTRNTRLRKAGISQKMRKEMLGQMSDEANNIYDHTDLQDHLEVVKKVEAYAGKRTKKVPASQVLEFKKAL